MDGGWNRISNRLEWWMSRYKCLFISLLMVLLLLSPSSLPAQDDTLALPDTVTELLDFDEFVDSVMTSRYVYDSSAFEPRTISSSDINSYRDDSEFDYARSSEPPANVIEQLFIWFFGLFGKIFDNSVTSSFMKVLPYLLFGVAVILVVWLLLRGEGSGLFLRRGSKNKQLDFEEVPEDIHALDFDSLIGGAVSAADFRKAVRLHYLYLLRVMSERDMIEWRPEKTNGDYLREVGSSEYRSRFTELTLLFDYIWYGGFEIDRNQYNRVSATFTSLRSELEARR